MKLKLVFFVILLALFPASLFSNTLYFPQVAFGGGYSTTFAIVNTGTTAVSGRLNLYSQSGGLRSDLGAQLDIAPGNSTRFTIPNSGPLTAVWGEFNAGAGTVQGVATFDYRDNTGRLVTSAGVLGIEANNTFLLPVDVTTSASTGIAVANVSNTPLTLEIQLIAENGVTVATSIDGRFAPIPAHGQVADFATSIISQIAGTPSFKGTLVIRSLATTPSLAATALTINEGLLSALPVAAGTSGGATILEFPQVAFGGGYSTTFTIMNAGPGLVQAQMRFFTQAGVEREDLARTISVIGNGSSRTTLPNVGPLTVVWGELITISGTVQGVATFDLRAANQSLITTAGVLGIQPGNAFSLPVDVTPTGGTGVAVANTKDTSVGVTLRLLGENGALVATATDPRFTTFPGRGQAADFITNIFPQLVGSTFRGALVVQAGAGAQAGSLAATALAVKEGLLSALPVIPGTLVIGAGGGGTGGGGTGGGGTGGGGTVGGGPASACLNPAAFTGSFTSHLEYNMTGVITGTSVTDSVSTPNATFEGQSASEVQSTTTTSFTGLQTTIAGSKGYFRLEGSDILTFGTTAEVTSPLVGSIKIVNTPPKRDRRFTLAVGESASQTYTVTSTSTFSGLPNPITSSQSLTDTVRYLGRENVSVLAGTFDTCKFDEGNGATIVWMGAGNAAGVLIKSQSSTSGGTATLELKTGTLNGSTVSP